MIHQKPTILIEAKSLTESINEEHIQQVNYYFTSFIDCRIGILTNGRHYQFYTDLDRLNIMDHTPFLSFDLEHFDETDIAYLKSFCRSIFNSQSVYNAAKERKKHLQAQEFLLQQM